MSKLELRSIVGSNKLSSSSSGVNDLEYPNNFIELKQEHLQFFYVITTNLDTIAQCLRHVLNFVN